MVQNNKPVNKPTEDWSSQMARRIMPGDPNPSTYPIVQKPEPAPSHTSDQSQIISKLPKHGATNCFPMELGPDPKKIIDGLRKASGPERLEGLMSFQSNIDQMSEKELKTAQNYLVDVMASPHNSDDELLGSLLKAVNNELNSRHENFPIKPHPINIKDFPGPVAD